jgi:hypothetical protein
MSPNASPQIDRCHPITVVTRVARSQEPHGPYSWATATSRTAVHLIVVSVCSGSRNTHGEAWAANVQAGAW